MKVVESFIYGSDISLYIKYKDFYYKLRYLEGGSSNFIWYKCIMKPDSQGWDLLSMAEQVAVKQSAIPTKVRNFAKEQLAKELI